MSAGDLLTGSAILAFASWLLYRSLWRRGGACAGCAGGCRRRREEAASVVQLGGARRPEP